MHNRKGGKLEALLHQVQVLLGPFVHISLIEAVKDIVISAYNAGFENRGQIQTQIQDWEKRHDRR